MAKSKSRGISRRNFIGVSIGSVVVAGVGCSSSSNNGGAGGGASDLTGGSPGAGGEAAAGGNPGTGGASTTGTGVAQTGGAQGAGGSAAAGGGPGTGGAGAGGSATGGKSAANGGSGTGGAATGGKSAANGGSGTGGAATGGKSAANGGSGTGGAATGGKSATATGGAATGGASSTGGSALVGLARGTDWVQATMDAIALAGGLPDLTGKSVMIRVNAIENTADATTSPDVIHGVLKAVKAKGATNITVAEDGWNANGNTLGVMQSLGITAVCTAEGATPMDLSKQTYTTRTNANATAYPSGVDFSDPVYNADYVIAVPKCKTHSAGKFTMALKLWYGNTKQGRSHSNWNSPPHLHLIRKADFTVLDATRTMITGGPSAGGKMVDSKVVAASKDVIAADVTGLFIEKYSGCTLNASATEIWNQAQIKGALAAKIPGCITSSQQFTYAQQGVTEAADIMGY